MFEQILFLGIQLQKEVGGAQDSAAIVRRSLCDTTDFSIIVVETKLGTGISGLCKPVLICEQTSRQK